jgi:hypothetical protein
MSLQPNLISNCSSVDVTVTDALSGASATDIIRVTDYSGLVGVQAQAVTGLPSGGSLLQTVSMTANGVYIIEFLQDGTVVDSSGLVVACDIDCCLASLTEELIDCSCECPKCSITLAKAQKIFLLLKSANTSAGLYNLANLGYIENAYNKYLKAKEMCTGSCGCDC